MSMSTIYTPRSPGKHLVLLCAGEHRVDVEAWARTVPTVCPIATCGERFLSPQERAARTRAAMQAITALNEATLRRPTPTFDEDGWVVDLTPVPACENPF